MESYKKVLDKGYVRLVTYMPWNAVELTNSIEQGNIEQAQQFIQNNDLAVVNAARASFLKEANVLRKQDIGLLSFLGEGGHDSPLRHATITFEVKCPMFVARQWFKYRVGSEHTGDTAELIGVPNEYVENVLTSVFGGNGDDQGFETSHGRNEASRRYITLEPEFHVPDSWRKRPDDMKQGSGDNFSNEDSESITIMYEAQHNRAMEFYGHMLKIGVAPEQARLAMPSAYGLYTVWRWTCSLQSVIHFLKQRLDTHAQKEIQEYALAVKMLAEQVYPHCIKNWLEER